MGHFCSLHPPLYFMIERKFWEFILKCHRSDNYFSFLLILLSPSSLKYFPFFFLGANISDTALSQIFKRSLFSVEEFHYLNVPRVGIFTTYDDFHCTLNCLNNALCFSVNMAASKRADGKLWCELLSSDKYRNSTEYRRNQSSHHLTMMVGFVFWILSILFE